MKGKISASLMCADLMHLESDLRLLEKNGVDFLHCDVMDGHFVPNWMMFPDLINAVGESTALPLDIHLMIEDPSAILPRLKLRKGDIVSVHAESTPHLQRAIAAIREAGAVPSVALNPCTPLCMAREALDEIGMLLIMTVNPGFSGQRMTPSSLQKITRARALLDELGHEDIPIQADGNCSLSNAPLMLRAGAEILVAGTSSVFDKNLGIRNGVRALREAMNKLPLG